MYPIQLAALSLIIALLPCRMEAGELDLPAEPHSSGCNLSLIGGQDRRTFDLFDQDLRSAVKGANAQDFVPLLAFPVRVNRNGGAIHIKNEKQFLKEASQTFTHDVRQAVTNTAGFFCNSGGLTYGGGTVWVRAYHRDGKEYYGITAINVPEVDPAAADNPTPKAECLTPRHHIIIDKPRDKLRYRSWSRSKTPRDKPDLELRSGTESAEGTGACSYWIYAFANGNTRYVFTEPGCTQDAPPPGSLGELEVKQKDKVLGKWWCIGL